MEASNKLIVMCNLDRGPTDHSRLCITDSHSHTMLKAIKVPVKPLENANYILLRLIPVLTLIRHPDTLDAFATMPVKYNCR